MFSASAERHHLNKTATIITIILALVIGGLYWWSASIREESPVSNLESELEKYLESIKDSRVQVTETDVENSLRSASNSKVNVTEDEIEKSLNESRNKLQAQ